METVARTTFNIAPAMNISVQLGREVKILKLKILTILGLVMTAALVATTFAVYSYAAPTQIRGVNEEHGEMSGEHHEMHNRWGGMHDGCMGMMGEMPEEEHNSTMHNETEEFHHGCH